jgi:hypothetical protein
MEERRVVVDDRELLAGTGAAPGLVGVGSSSA